MNEKRTTLFGQNIKQAYNEIVNAKEVPKPKIIIPQINNPENYVQIPEHNCIISLEELFKNNTWTDSHSKLEDIGLSMATVPRFTQHFQNVIAAYKNQRKLFKANGQELTREEVEDLYKYFTTNHRTGCWTWLDAKFEEVNGVLRVNYEHKTVKGILQPGKSEDLETYRNEDCYVDLEFNRQGFPKTKSTSQNYQQGNNIKFYKPVNGRVARFRANSNWASLICYRDPANSDAGLGVFGCAEGADSAKFGASR